MRGNVYVGLDVGSASVNIVGVATDGTLVGRPVYTRIGSFPSPVAALKHAFAEYRQSLPETHGIGGIGTTGSGRELNKHIVGGDLTRTEIFAHAVGIAELARTGRLAADGCRGPHRCDRVGTVIEIGGQDAKVIIFDEQGVPAFFNMNSICSAGTGEFLQQIADEAGIPIAEFGPIALTARQAVKVDTTCTVFSKRDFRHLTQKGVPLPDRLMGICHAMVHNYTRNVIGTQPVRPPVIFQGGVAANSGVREAFRQALGTEILKPPFHDVMGALGMAVIVRDLALGRASWVTQFKDDFGERRYDSRIRYCHGCPNSCEITQPLECRPGQMDPVVLDSTGNRCDGYARPGNLQATPPPVGVLAVPVIRTPRPPETCFDIVSPGQARARSSTGLCFAGLDGGSRGTKAALLRSLGEQVEVIEVRAFDTAGDALAALAQALRHLRESLPPGEGLAGVGTTGSAGELFRDIITRRAARTSDYRSTEILAHYAWASYQHPNVGTVLDIGGNDAKIISVQENGLDFAMNDKCAAGTGAFLEAVSRRFDVPISQYAQVAFASSSPARVSGRCAVFGESDIIHKARAGFPGPDLFLGLAYSVCRTYLSDIGKGKEIRVPIVAQGGTFLNDAVLHAFRDTLGLGPDELIRYPDTRFVLGAGALGAALLAKGMYERGYDSAFKGFDAILGSRYDTITTRCRHAPCTRRCEGLVALRENDRVISGYKSIDCDYGLFDGLAASEDAREAMSSGGGLHGRRDQQAPGAAWQPR
ncbi:MAG: hypothetical protein HY321_04050 [Armatimonadetes bacterium]|nr:hypothetical protein [Armatimonadota bacterium]